MPRKSKDQTLPLGSIRNPESMVHPKHHSLFGRLNFQGMFLASWNMKNVGFMSRWVAPLDPIARRQWGESGLLWMSR